MRLFSKNHCEELAKRNHKLILERRENGLRDEERRMFERSKEATKIDKKIYDIMSKEKDFIPNDSPSAEAKGFTHIDTGKCYYIYIEDLKE